MKSVKLVRDNIPEFIRAKGVEPKTYSAGDLEYDEELKEKLLEEVNEYIDQEQPEEIADILEVIDAICLFKGFSLEEILERKKKKFEDRGGFAGRVMLEI